MPKPRIAIIGAGITGLFAANSIVDKAKEKFAEIAIFEKGSKPGGLISSTEKQRRVWDNGIFIFFNDSPLVQLFPDEFSIIEDHVQLAWNGKNFNEFPLSINTIIKTFPKYKIGLVLGDYFISRLRLKLKLTRPNFHDWLRYRITRAILDHSMLENYIVKLQGIKPIELSDSLGYERFSDIDASTKPINLFMKLYNSIKINRANQKAEPMYYFARGAGSFADKMANLCISKGIKIYYDSTIANITKKSSNVFELRVTSENRQYSYDADFVIATNPITNFCNISNSLLQNEKYDYQNSLSYKKLLLIFYAINKPIIKNRHLLLYSLDPNQPWKRLKAHSQPDNTTHLIVESIVDYGRANQTDSLEQSVTNSLINELNLFKPEDILTVERSFISEAYPIYKLGHEQISQAIISKLREQNVFLCGRQGAFRYFSSDKAILSATNAAENIIKSIA
jgi:protoporphyrinogen oxidase